jgi:hypothetical protein
MNSNTPYKCWPSRDTDNSQSVAMLSNGNIAYNKCGAEVNISKSIILSYENEIYLDISTTTNIIGSFLG